MLVTKNKTISLVVLSPSDLNWSQVAGLDNYKGIILLFDADLDERLFLFVKKYYKLLIPSVRAVFESHGTVTLFTHKPPAVPLTEFTSADLDIDTWTVEIVDLTKTIYRDKGGDNGK